MDIFQTRTPLLDSQTDAIGVPQKLELCRLVYTQDAFNKIYKPEQNKSQTFVGKIREKCSSKKIKKNVISFFPIVKSVTTYKFKEFILGDFLSGITTSFIHLPQALGFAFLASLRPIYGLYTSFFSVLVYLLFGTSPHISFGPNSVLAVLTHEIVEQEAKAFNASRMAQHNGTEKPLEPSDNEIMDVKIRTAMACCFLAGIFLILLGLLRLGILTTYLSMSFVGGFTTASAIHIASSQVPKMFGIKVQNRFGAGKLVLMYTDLFRNIQQINWAEIGITVVSILILMLVKTCINERFKSRMKIPIPIDLVLVICGTILSYFVKFKDNWNVETVGTIPSGFTTPDLPRFENVGNIVQGAFVMAIISFALSISMAKLVGNKHGIQTDDNQELFAYGACNLVSSFFHCFPSATSPPRTMMLSSLGSKTTLNAIPTVLFILLVIFVIGQLFATLPLSVLAAMIIVSMKELLLQYRDLPKIWRINKFDFVVWLATNLTSIFVDLNYGILAGVCLSIFFIIVQDQLALGTLLHVSDKEDIVVKQTIESNCKNQAHIKIFKVPTNLYFATAEIFKSQMYSMVLNPHTHLKHMYRINELVNGTHDKSTDVVTDVHKEVNEIAQVIIIDCTFINYIDMAGIAVLQQVIQEYTKINVKAYLTGVPENSRRKMEAAGFFVLFPRKHMYLDVFDVLAILDLSLKPNEDAC